MLDKDPTMGGKQIAARLDISLSRLARVFKAELGMSLVAYRNRLRMERFSALVDQGHTNLLGAALAAGFGSYAQFHRVFRALGRTAARHLAGRLSGPPPPGQSVLMRWSRVSRMKSIPITNVIAATMTGYQSPA